MASITIPGERDVRGEPGSAKVQVITALSEETLRATGTTSLDQIQYLVPNLSIFRTGNGQTASIVLRGVGNFPFVYYDDNQPYKPVAPRMSSARDSVRVPLIFDGFFMHQIDWRHFQLRHGNLRGPAKNRLCNFVFLDGHAEGIRGSRLPKGTPTFPPPADNMYLPENLTSTAIWDIRMCPLR